MDVLKTETAPLVSVTIVTYNSSKYIAGCLEALCLHDYPALEVVVVDNHSQDSSRSIVEGFSGRLAMLRINNDFNHGFCGGQNQAIAASHGAWVLALNPDVVLAPEFISRLISGIEARNDPAVGIACGRLLSAEPRCLDSTGMYFTPQLRHFDRDGRMEDRGQHRSQEYVFGASGAAALYRRAMIEAISIPTANKGPGAEFFDVDFFAYREDADLSWRAQLMGWNCLYVPDAVGSHVRTCRPENRARMPAVVNMHSVKNRFLMRIKNIGAGLYLRHFVAITLRDLCVVVYCLFKERTSLPGLAMVLRDWRKAWAKRCWIQSRRRRSDRELAVWFNAEPVALAMPPAIDLPAVSSTGESKPLPLDGDGGFKSPAAVTMGRRP
jgi:GT2 family glycosyltransferase